MMSGDERSFKSNGRYFPTLKEAQDHALNCIEEAFLRDDVRGFLFNAAMTGFGGNIAEKIDALADQFLGKFDITYKATRS